MTIHKLRSATQIRSYHNDLNNGAVIDYFIGSSRYTLTLTCSDFKGRLFEISSIDDDITDEDFEKYKISQWDALNIVIRHEYAKYIESEIMDSDIGKAINNITK